MKDYHINIFYSNEDKGYIADILDLEACSAFGKTPQEALKEVQIAKVAWLKSAREAKNQSPSRGIVRLSTKPSLESSLSKNQHCAHKCD